MEAPSWCRFRRDSLGQGVASLPRLAGREGRDGKDRPASLPVPPLATNWAPAGRGWERRFLGSWGPSSGSGLPPERALGAPGCWCRRQKDGVLPNLPGARTPQPPEKPPSLPFHEDCSARLSGSRVCGWPQRLQQRKRPVPTWPVCYGTIGGCSRGQVQREPLRADSRTGSYTQGTERNNSVMVNAGRRVLDGNEGEGQRGKVPVGRFRVGPQDRLSKTLPGGAGS